MDVTVTTTPMMAPTTRTRSMLLGPNLIGLASQSRSSMSRLLARVNNGRRSFQVLFLVVVVFGCSVLLFMALSFFRASSGRTLLLRAHSHPHAHSHSYAHSRAISRSLALTSLNEVGHWIRERRRASSSFCPEVVALGTQGGKFAIHHVCDTPRSSSKCIAISYGVGHSMHFELDVRDKFNCRVFALDPTINMTASPADYVHFIGMGAPSAYAAYKHYLGTEKSQTITDKWVTINPARLAQAVARRRDGEHQRIAVLKMDCEGCEYLVYREIMSTDARFFDRVDQFVVEVHLTRSLGLVSFDDAIALGQLYALLGKSNLTLRHASVDHCARSDEATGVIAAVQGASVDYFRDGEGMCQNLLFAR